MPVRLLVLGNMNITQTYITHAPSDLPMVVLALLDLARASAAITPHATIVTLQGELGTGKTTLVQTLGEALRVREVITSPTFVVMKAYSLAADENWDRLVHIDAYRFDSPEEALPIGLPALLLQERTLICIEWPERIAPYLSTAHLAIKLVSTGETSRTLTVDHL